jgi:hypothetical protein
MLREAHLQNQNLNALILTNSDYYKELLEEVALMRARESSIRNQIYHPKPDDATDRVLGDFLCKYAEQNPFKILFLRESEGVYQFGQKRVYIKIEKGNKILVKVGGGFLKIEDFIQLYTSEEVEKLKGRDVVARFHNKLGAQRIAARMSVACREESPIKSPQRPNSLSEAKHSKMAPPSRLKH